MSFSYDANGNMAQRQYYDASSVKQTQALAWDSANRLTMVTESGQAHSTYFGYDADGLRSRKQQGASGNLVVTIYPAAHYEVAWVQVASAYTPTRYYLFNGEAIALREGSQAVTYLHRDQVGSVVMTTQNGAIADSRMYYAYGSKRGGDEYPFELNYTGQRKDDTGLLYYKARYYDPEIGLFISPDTIIPDPGDPFSYNRFLYGRGNPISNNDPSGHLSVPCCVTGLPTLAGRALKQVYNLLDRSGTLQAVGMLLEASPAIACQSLRCDLTLADVEAAYSDALETYVHPHLPDQMHNAMETVNAVMALPGVADAMMATVGVPSRLTAGAIVPYGTRLEVGSGLQKHHGVLNVWAEANIPGYSRNAAPSVLMSEQQHNATRSIFAQWRVAKTGSTSGRIDWSNVSSREIQNVSEAMFDAAGISPDVRAQYYAEFNRFIYGLIGE